MECCFVELGGCGGKVFDGGNGAFVCEGHYREVFAIAWR